MWVELIVEIGVVLYCWSVIFDLGIFFVFIDEVGLVFVDEMRLCLVIIVVCCIGLCFDDEICDLLGELWDVELELY